MLFQPAYSKDLTNDLTKPMVATLNKPAFLDFFWNFTTRTNAGRCFVIAILALGFFSSLGIAIVALPIGSIPIVGYILTFVTGIGSFGALLVMAGVVTPVVFSYFKKRDIWTFPSVITTGLKMITRCQVAIDFLRRINWECLELEKAGSNLKQIFNDLSSALATRTIDKKKYGNAPVKYVGKILAMKELPQILGAVIRATDAIMRLRRQENFDFAVVKYYDTLLCTLQSLKDYIAGNYDEAIGKSPAPYISGITHTILKITDGQAADPDKEYKNASIQYLTKSITSSVLQSQLLSEAFTFSVDSEMVMTDPAIDVGSADTKLKEKIEAWRNAVTANAMAVIESLRERVIDVSPETGIKLYKIFGTEEGVEIKLPHEAIGGIVLPDEIIQLLKAYQHIGETISPHSHEEAEQIKLPRGRAIPPDMTFDATGEACWMQMNTIYDDHGAVGKFFSQTEDVESGARKGCYHVPAAWTPLNVKLGDTSLKVALPAIFMIDRDDNVWIALAGTENNLVVRTSEWVKYDPTDPDGTVATLCEVATGKTLMEARKEEEEEWARNREKVEEFKKKVASRKKQKPPSRTNSKKP